MINQIMLEHFKCFNNLVLELSDLTLLCGLNGMGKSSIIQALLLVRQSIASGELDRGYFVLNGNLVNLGRASDILYEDASSDVVTIAIGEIDWDTPYVVSINCSSSARDSGPLLEDMPQLSAQTTLPDDWDVTPPFGGNVMYVPAERPGPQKLYDYSEYRARGHDLGPKCEYAVNYLHSVQDDILPLSDKRCPNNVSSRRIGDIVDYWLNEVTPGSHLDLSGISNADAILAEYSFERPDDVRSRGYRAINVGFGLSYILPVVAALLAPPGSLCLIENPEAHLHPRGQTRLAELAIQACSAGVQVLVETHSDHFLDGIRIGVHDKLMEPSKVTIHYFERESGESRVTSPQILENGNLSTWPAHFFDQHELNLAHLISPSK